MSPRAALVRALAFFSIASVAVACKISEATYEETTEAVRAPRLEKTCDSPFVAPDMSTLEACGTDDAKGHCYDGSKTMLVDMPACKGSDVCVPDSILTLNGGGLKPCTFFVGNKPGVCMSLLVPDMAKHKDQLQKDVCADDERCAPCIDPTNQRDTHLCDPQGVHEKACKGGAGDTEMPCCHGAGACLNTEGVPEDKRDQMHIDVCNEGQLCAPSSMVDGEPVHCSALGLSGVCMDLCFASMLAPAGHVIRGDCGPTEVCLPCIVGSGEGVPGC